MGVTCKITNEQRVCGCQRKTCRVLKFKVSPSHTTHSTSPITAFSAEGINRNVVTNVSQIQSHGKSLPLNCRLEVKPLNSNLDNRLEHPIIYIV